jgi:hypothetical protein
LYLSEARHLTWRTHTTSSLTQVKVHNSEEEMQLQRKGVLVKGFGYLLKDYHVLVVCYPILVRVFGLSFVWWDLS